LSYPPICPLSFETLHRAEADLALEVLGEAILSKIPRARKYMSDYMKTKESLAQQAYLNRPLQDLFKPL
jgi:hypothetical protein